MKEMMTKLYVTCLMATTDFKKFLKNEQGDTNIIAIILILAIVVLLAIVFRRQLTALFNRIWSGINDNIDDAIN